MRNLSLGMVRKLGMINLTSNILLALADKKGMHRIQYIYAHVVDAPNGGSRITGQTGLNYNLD